LTRTQKRLVLGFHPEKRKAMLRKVCFASVLAAGLGTAAGSEQACAGSDESSLLQKVIKEGPAVESTDLEPESTEPEPADDSAESTEPQAAPQAMVARRRATPKKPHKPNIVFMLIDDLGWADTEYGGAGTADRGFIRTPIMKSLKKDALKLNKMYAYSWCAPSRSSLLSGRLPIHVDVNHSNPMAFVPDGRGPIESGEGIPAGMTTIGTKMKEAGYATHYVGKWGVGFTWKHQNPMWRGFDSFFGYLHDSVDFWNQKLGAESIEVPGGCESLFRNLDIEEMAVDLIRNDKPASSENGTEWVDYLFLNESLSIINNHETSTPLFLFHAFHSVHAPLNAPAELYTDNYAPPPCEGEDAMRTCFNLTGSLNHDDRRSYAAMVTFTDTAIGKMVDALKAKEMWDNTLVIVSADNGGAQYLSHIGYQLWGSGNNAPLRGGKTSDWEGGIRVNSFATGGLIPKKMRGKETDALIHFADWFGTFCYLAGVDQKDQMAISNGLPDVDSINQWPILSGEKHKSQRTDIQISPVTLLDYAGKWKLLTGPDPGNINTDTTAGYVPFDTYAVGYWTGFPNEEGSQDRGAVYGSFSNLCPKLKEKVAEPLRGFVTCSLGQDCRNGCLYNLDEDPGEHNDVAAKHPQVHKEMMEKLAKGQKKWTAAEPWGVFNPVRAGDDPNYDGPWKCSGDSCTSTEKCNEFVFVTGFYSWAADADELPTTEPQAPDSETEPQAPASE